MRNLLANREGSEEVASAPEGEKGSNERFGGPKRRQLSYGDRNTTNSS